MTTSPSSFKVNWVHDSLCMEASAYEIQQILNLLSFAEHNGLSLGQLYEYLSSMIRAKIVITRGDPGSSES